MRLNAAIQGDLKQIMAGELAAATKGVTQGIERAATILKGELRHQVAQTTKGTKLASAWRQKFFFNKGLNAAAIVYSKAPNIITSFEEGSTIVAKKSRFLAIPTPYAKGLIGGRLKATPAMCKAKGIPLVFLRAQHGHHAMLILDFTKYAGVRVGKSGRASLGIHTKTGKIRSGTIVTFVPMFILLEQVKLRKRLDVKGATEKAARLLPLIIMRNYQQASQSAPGGRE